MVHIIWLPGYIDIKNVSHIACDATTWAQVFEAAFQSDAGFIAEADKENNDMINRDLYMRIPSVMYVFIIGLLLR